MIKVKVESLSLGGGVSKVQQSLRIKAGLEAIALLALIKNIFNSTILNLWRVSPFTDLIKVEVAIEVLHLLICDLAVLHAVGEEDSHISHNKIK